MSKSEEFEVSFTPVLNVDVKQFKKRVDNATKYYLGANIFTIFDNGNLIVSSPSCIVRIKNDKWICSTGILCEKENSVSVFISIWDDKQMECSYESELPKF